MYDYHWNNLPSVKRKTSMIADKLLQPTNVLWFFPEIYTNDAILKLVDQVENSCKEYELNVTVLVISSSGDNLQSPISYLVDHLEIKTNQLNPAIEVLLEHENWPDVLIISGLEGLEGETFNRWVRFLKKWSQLTNSTTINAAKKIFLVTLNKWPGQEMIPKEDLKIKLEYFYNVISQVDKKFLVEANYSNEATNDHYWTNSVLVEITLDDPFLLNNLIENKAGDEQSIMTELLAYGERLGWGEDKELIHKLHLIFMERDYDKFNIGSFQELIHFWTKGFICYTGERGLEIHSAALAIIQEEGSIRRRIWRGQLSLFYQTLDNIRFRISRYLTKTYGENWVKKIPPKYEFDCVRTSEGPVSEYGHLKMVIKALSSEFKTAELLELLDYVQVFWQTRNKLAHYRELSRKEFDHTISYLEKF